MHFGKIDFFFTVLLCELSTLFASHKPFGDNILFFLIIFI